MTQTKRPPNMDGLEFYSLQAISATPDEVTRSLRTLATVLLVASFAVLCGSVAGFLFMIATGGK